MSEEDQKALEAARLYSKDSTFQDIADKLETSKSHAQVLVRRGIELSLKEQETIQEETTEDSPMIPEVLENPNPAHLFPYSQNPRMPESFTLETSGIPKRIVLTPKAIMIYDLWKGSGFEGDLSDFLEDSINFLYESKRPAERFR